MANKPHFLIAAGNTREKIDAVRDWGNIFTGKTGLDIALALLDLGDVTLLTSNRTHAADYDGYYGKMGMLGIETFHTHADLRELLQERLTGKDAAPTHAVFMAAAVSDYQPEGTFSVLRRDVSGSKIRTPSGEEMAAPPGQEIWLVENVQAPKVKSSHSAIAVLGMPTEKLIDLFRTRWHYRGLLVKFKLEVGITEEELIRVAAASRVASQADYIVANTLEMVRPSSAGVEPAAYLLGPNLQERLSRQSLPARLSGLVQSYLSTL